MKSIVDTLSPKVKALLADFYEKDEYKAFKTLLEAERLNISTYLLDVPADDVTVIARMQGRADACKQLHKLIKEVYTKERAKEDLKP